MCKEFDDGIMAVSNKRRDVKKTSGHMKVKKLKK